MQGADRAAFHPVQADSCVRETSGGEETYQRLYIHHMCLKEKCSPYSMWSVSQSSHFISSLKQPVKYKGANVEA